MSIVLTEEDLHALFMMSLEDIDNFIEELIEK